jgi:signal transduction histidine kinase/ligand-binding sensor domain-containing protein
MKRHLKALLFVLFPLLLHAQQKSPHFEHLQGDLNVAGGLITKIIQDKQGYFWISTMQNGLFKYDGYTTTRYEYDPFDVHSVPQNQIYTFFIDKNDTIWVGTAEGLSKFDRHSEKFIRYNSSLVRGLPDLRNVGAINEDDQGNLWIGNYEGKLWRYNRRSGEFLSLTSKFNYKEQKSLSSDFHEGVFCIYKNKKGTIWIGNTNGFHQVINSTGTVNDISFIHYQNNPLDANSLSNNKVNNIYEDRNGMVWAETNSGLNSLDPATGRITRYLTNPSNPLTISTNYLQAWGNSIAEDLEGNLWIATPYGLNKLNKERTVFTRYFQNDLSEFGLRSSRIHTLGMDAGTNLFVSTAKGLQSLILDQKAFDLLQHDPKDHNSISSNEVISVIEDKSGSIWIGTAGEGLNKWDRKTDKFIHYNSDQPNSLKSDYVSDIMEYPEGDLWVCNGEYLSLVKNGSEKFEHFNSNSRNLESWDAKTIISICHDNDGLIWMGTGNGIKSFDPVTKKFTHYYFELNNPDGVSDYTVVGILADSRGNIWVGNNSIAFDRFDKHTGRFTHYKNNALDTTSISSNIVYCIFEDSKKNLWIGTFAGGLCQYNYATNDFTTNSRNKDIPWNSVFSIREDNAGNLWLGTDKGLSCYIVSQKRFINYDVKDGLQDNLFAAGWRNKGSSFKGKDGIIYLGGTNGLNYFDPARIHPNNFIPPIVITQFKIFDKLQPGKNEEKEIVLNYDQNFFSFEFAALNYTNTSKNKYAYQLEGFDKDWVYCGTRRYAGYTNLDPDEYTFRVKGSNNDGIWNEKGIAIKIIIRPPWWKTRLAYAVYILLLIALGWAIHRYQRQRVIRIERERSQKKELAQAKEIEKAYHELKTTQQQLIQSEKMASLGELTSGIAHEIQNPLNFVNNFSEVNRELIEELKSEKRKVKSEKSEVLENELIDNILQNEEKINHHGKRADAIVKSMLQHSRGAESGNKKEPTDINALADEYFRLAYHGFKAKEKSFNSKMVPIAIGTNFDPAIGNINVVPQEIGRVLLNLINNAFYAVHEKKKLIGDAYDPIVSVNTKKVGGKVEIIVKDNGNGIPPKILDKIFNPFFTTKPTGQGTGLGLSLAYDIVKAHGGSIKVISFFREPGVLPIDIGTIGINGKTATAEEGTEFIIQLPVNNNS